MAESPFNDFTASPLEKLKEPMTQMATKDNQAARDAFEQHILAFFPVAVGSRYIERNVEGEYIHGFAGGSLQRDWGNWLEGWLAREEAREVR